MIGAKTQQHRAATIAIALVVALGTLTGVLAGEVNPAAAASAADWDPGYIIDDAVFYDSTSMTATDVQTFLNGKVSSCRAGYTCLKSYAAAAPNMASSTYCAAYQGGWQSAAQIIDGVARACGISQRVILVMLEKEQSLVTSTGPTNGNYAAAMGQSCPDNGGCDPAYSGFFYQVYYAARQFQVYRRNPTSFGYRAQRWNTILYNPNVACGSQQVFINNQATAALYIYTPYVPNAAALNNLYGTGDSCSAYGNRNFWRMFTDWFGNPRYYQVMAGFVDYWNAHGGANGSLGPPTSYGVYVAQNGQGWYQRFRGGILYGSYQGGTAFVPNGAILSQYNAYGAASGSLGFPNGEQSCTADGRCMQSFVNAVITSTPNLGAHVSWGGFRDYWVTTGGLDGSLGAAVSDIGYFQASGGTGWVQQFQKAMVAAAPTGMFSMPVAVGTAWVAAGSATGILGWPTAAYACSGTTCSQPFQGGYVSYADGIGAHSIWGGFASVWQSAGGSGGTLGVATADIGYLDGTGGGWTQPYQAGVIAISKAYGSFVVPKTQAAVWLATGGVGGWLGWPTGSLTCSAAGCQQSFQGGVVTSSATAGTHAVVGGFAPWWNGAGGLGGPGAATTDLSYSAASGGGWSQVFVGGTAAQARGSTVVFTTGKIDSTWTAWGGPTSWLGWPTNAIQCSNDSCGQAFQGGALTHSDASGLRGVVGGLGVYWGQTGGIPVYGAATADTRYSDASGGGWLQSFAAGVISQTRGGSPIFTPSGPILSTWLYYGAERTWLGFPTSAQSCTTSGCAQQFQGGVATSSPSGAVIFSPR